MGRFRTALPADSRETIRIGFFSCQAFEAGYYNAHVGLANEDVDVDGLPRRLHLREGLLRERAGGAGRPHGRQRRRRGPDPRRVPRQVRALPLRPAAARGAAEVPAAGHRRRPRGRGQLGARPAGRGDERRARAVPRAPRNGYRAFFEHMPRDPRRWRRPTGRTGRSRSAPTPSSSCSTSGATATTSRAATSSSSRATSPRRRGGRCSAPSRRRGSPARSSRRARRGSSSPTR